MTGSAVLIKWLGGGGSSLGQTFDVPALSGFIWVKDRSQERMDQRHTGTGIVADSIEWGDADGWTIVGGAFCHSVPASVCDLASRQDSETVLPPFISSHYDVHSWTFHGTGFRGDPRLTFTQTAGSFGNSQTVPRGALAQSGTVPSLPLVGLGAIGISVIAMGIASLRGRGR